MLDYLIEQDRIKKLLNELLNPGFVDMEDPEGAAREIAEWHEREDDEIGKRVELETLPTFIAPSEIADAFYELWMVLCDFRTSVFISDICVHGSYASGDFVKSSDLDMAYILTEDTSVDTHGLLELRDLLDWTTKPIKHVDPLQHHGPYILTPKIMRNYLESYLPLDVWKESRPVWGLKKLDFYVQDSPYHNKLWFKKIQRIL